VEEETRKEIQSLKNGVHSASVGDPHLSWHGGLSGRGSDCCCCCCCCCWCCWTLGDSCLLFTWTAHPERILQYGRKFCSSLLFDLIQKNYSVRQFWVLRLTPNIFCGKRNLHIRQKRNKIFISKVSKLLSQFTVTRTLSWILPNIPEILHIPIT